MASDLAKLEAWLRENISKVGSTVLVPLRKETKQPLVAHAKPGAWTWEAYDEFVRKNPAHTGWGLLLDGLCVVDADDADSVEWLEGLAHSTIAELSRCPVQMTSKGRHYVFIRPTWADAEGYYDGARQCGAGRAVDLKTRCRTGTRGLLVVAPTPGKRWADGRAPWDDAMGVRLEEMPRVLLELVAKPKETSTTRPGRPEAKAADHYVHAVESLPSVSGSDAIVKMLHLLSKARWDAYASWRDIATVLKNEADEKYRSEWLRLSRSSAKFEQATADKLWETVACEDYEGPRLTQRTLRLWAAADDPIGYQACRASTVAPLVLAKYSEGDRGLAEIAHHVLGNTLKRVGTKGDIYYFKEADCRWCRGDEASVMLQVSYAVEEALRDVDAHLAARAATTVDDAQRAATDETRKQVMDRVTYIRKRVGMANVTHLATRLCQEDGFDQRLDSKPHLLGVKNGVIDLRTGVLRQRVPEDMIFTVVDVDYTPAASTQLFDDTVMSIMADDAEMALYLQKFLGYAVTGEVCEEIFVVFTAGGRNGKGLLMQAVALLLGPLYVEMNCGIIINRQVANLDAERGKLFGARVAVFNELEAGEKLKTSEVQLLSGGDGIPATPKYRDPMTIIPRHTCILTTNHLPELNEVVVATIERFQVIPFPVTFVDLAEGESPTATRRQRDNDLKRRLNEDREGLLRWLVKGSVMWYASRDLKRNAPHKVKEFSRKYFAEQDRVTAFVRERCVIEEGNLVPTQELQDALLAWCRANNKLPMTRDAFGKALRDKRFEKKKSRYPGYTSSVQCYVGISLVPHGGEADDLEDIERA